MRSKTIIEEEKDKIFSTLTEGLKYFQKRKKELKGTHRLMILGKEIKPNYWVGVKRN